MFRMVSIALRLVVVFALAVNGIGVAAYAMHARDASSPAEATAMPGGESPCHGMDGGDIAQPDTPVDDGALAPHDCCGKTCSCDFVAAAALAPLPFLAFAAPPSTGQGGFDAGRLVPAHARLPLRPPIA